VSELFDEVDEDVRRDQLKQLWDRYSIYIVAGALLIIAAVGGWRGYQYLEAKKAAEAGASFDHAVELYRKRIAPLVITLGGGSDKDSGNTEGGVGRDYLLANGIPFGSIIAETRSIDTEQQVHRLAAIARENNLHHIVVVSDATHLFRIRELCKDAGLDVYTSPRPVIGHISNYDLAMRYFHEIVSYTAMRLSLNVGWLHSWLEGKPDL